MAEKISEIPTSDPRLRREYNWAGSDKVAVTIVKYLLENERGYFNKMAKDFSTSGITSRNTLFGRLLRMEKAGIIHSDLISVSYGEERIQKWVKEYKISKKSLKWAESVKEIADAI